jgi:serine/threonine protein kinase
MRECEIVRVAAIEDKYRIIEEVGKGTYGKVYKCREIETGSICALKKIAIFEKYGGFPLNTIREVNILRSLHHENIIGLRAIITVSLPSFTLSGDSTVYLSFDYCEFDLCGLLYGASIVLSQVHIVSYIRQLLTALGLCHSHHILHRDLKPANLFVTRGNVLRLGDFGLARRIVEDREARYTSKVITLYYRAPELLLGSHCYGSEVDMWSVGCIIYEMITRKPLFQPTTRVVNAQVLDSDQCNVIWGLCGLPDPAEWPEVEKLPDWPMYRYASARPSCLLAHLRTTLPVEYTDAIDLIMKIVQITPSKRITAEEATNHPFLTRFGNQTDPGQLPLITAQPEIHQMAVPLDHRNARRKVDR